MKKERPMRYVQVQEFSRLQGKYDDKDDLVTNCSNLKIYDTLKYPYYIIDGMLYLCSNLDTTETIARDVYECLGTVIQQFDNFE